MGTRVVNKVSSRHFPWRPSLIQTPYRSAATQDEGAAPRRIRGKYFVFSKGEFFHNYPLARSAFVFGRGTNFRRQPVDIPLKALGQVNKSLLYTQTSFSGLDSSSSLFFSPLPLFQRSSSRLLAFIKITDRGAFVKKTRYLVLSWKRRAPACVANVRTLSKRNFPGFKSSFSPCLSTRLIFFHGKRNLVLSRIRRISHNWKYGGIFVRRFSSFLSARSSTVRNDH